MTIADEPAEPCDQRLLLARARAGEAEAFCRLVEPVQGRLFRQAVALTGDADAAEDIVSETLVEAWKSLARYDQSCRLSTWLYAILLHRHHKALRRANSRPPSLAGLPPQDAQALRDRQDDLPSPDPDPSERLLRDENGARIRNWIGRLPEKHQHVILLRFFEEASLPDMAAALGCSVGTVKSRLHHALEKLRKIKMNRPAAPGDKQI